MRGFAGKKLGRLLNSLSSPVTAQEIALTAIFILALALRLLHVCYAAQFPPVADEIEYSNYADSIISGSGFDTTFRGPGYPYFLGAVYRIYGDHYQIARAAQAFIGSFTCLLIFFLARRVFSETTGLLAAFISAAFALNIFYSGLLFTETLYVFLITLLALSFLSALDKPSVKNLALSGMLLAITALTRTEILVTSFFISIAFLVKNNLKLLPSMRQVGIVAASALLIILPWTIRNYQIEKTFVFISSQGGENLWIGNNPSATGGHTAISSEMRHKYATNIELEKALYKDALKFIKENPKAWLSLLGKKFRYYFRYWTNEFQWLFKSRFGFPHNMRVPLFSLTFVGLSAIIGIVITAPYAKRLTLFYAFLLGNLALQIMLHVEPRFRMQIIPFLIIFAASPVFLIEEYMKKRKK